PADIWVLGPHRIICADPRDPGSYERFLGEEKAQTVFTNLPQKLAIHGKVLGLDLVGDDELATPSEGMSPGTSKVFYKCRWAWQPPTPSTARSILSARIGGIYASSLRRRSKSTQRRWISACGTSPRLGRDCFIDPSMSSCWFSKSGLALT